MRIRRRFISFILIVTLLVPFFSSTSFAWGGQPELTHQARYQYSSKIYGVDVSKWQGSIDWNAAKAAGVEYAFIRIGYRGSSGGMAKDPWFETNYANARAAGVRVGVYFFSQALNQSEAIAEANQALAYLGGRYLDLPIMMDYEFSDRLRPGAQNPVDTSWTIYAFCNTIRNAGYATGLYANKSTLETWTYDDIIVDQWKFPLWLAHYTTNTSYAENFTWWQFSSKGSIPGISGNVDLDVWYGEPVYTIKYVLNDKKFGNIDKATNSNKSTYIAKDSDFNITDPTRPYYSFKGWYLDKDFETPAPTTIKCSERKNYTFYAKWEPVTYEISYDVSGAEGKTLSYTEALKTSYTIEDTFDFPMVQVEGLTFISWEISDGVNSSIIERVTAGNAPKNLELTARFVDPGEGYVIEQYAPLLDKNEVILNSADATSKEAVTLNPVAKSTITSVTTTTSGFAVNEFTLVSSNSVDGIYSFDITTTEYMEDGDYPVTIDVVIDGDIPDLAKTETYRIPITVKVRNELPSLEIVQDDVFNRFYLDETVDLRLVSNAEFDQSNPILNGATDVFASKNYTVNADTPTFANLTIGYANADGSLGEVDPETGLNSTLEVTANFKNYRLPVTREISLETNYVTPIIAQSRTSTRLFSSSNIGNAPIIISNALSGVNYTSADTSFELISDEEIGVTLDYDANGNLVITPQTHEKTVSEEEKRTLFANDSQYLDVDIAVKQNNWRNYVPISHRFGHTDYLSLLPSESAMYINAALETEAEIEMSCDLVNFDMSAVLVPDNHIVDKSSKGKISLNVENGKLKASIDSNNKPATGTYKFEVTPVYNGVDLTKFTVSVVISNDPLRTFIDEASSKTVIVYQAPSTNKDRYDTYDEASFTVSLSNDKYKIETESDITITPKDVNKDFFDFRLSKLENGVATYTVKPKASENEALAKPVNNATYNYQIKVNSNSISANEATLTLKAVNSKPGVELKTRGILPLVDRNSGLSYSVNKFTNTNLTWDNVAQVEFADTKYDSLFDVNKETDCIKLTCDKNYASTLKAGTNYTVAFRITFDNGATMITPNYTVRPVQDSAKVYIEGDRNIYVDAYYREYSWTVASDVCDLEKVIIDTSSMSEYIKSNFKYYIVNNNDGSFDVRMRVLNASNLQGNRNVRLSLVVTPKGTSCDSSGKKTTQKVSISLHTCQN